MRAKLLFVGDIYLNSNDPNRILFDENLEAIFSKCDVCSCNLEGAVYTVGARKIEKIGPSLIQSPNAARMLISNGFNCFSLANNHIWDYGRLAVEHTLDELETKIVVGLNTDPIYKIIEINGIRIALFAITEECFGCENEIEGGCCYFKRDDIFELIKAAKIEADYVIINVHAGAEMLEIPLPEIRELYKTYVDVGADLIIGHHPHIIQGYEEYKGKRIYYSLGNFIFDEMDDSDSRVGAIAIIELDKETKEIKHEFYLTVYEDERVKLKHDEDVMFKLNKKIDNIDEVNEWCLERYKEVFFPIFYQGNSFGLWNRTFIERCKTAIKIVLRKEKKSDLFMFHNINNETNYWIVRRALSLIATKSFQEYKK